MANQKYFNKMEKSTQGWALLKTKSRQIFISYNFFFNFRSLHCLMKMKKKKRRKDSNYIPKLLKAFRKLKKW